jgi:hypothetical protein
VTNIWEENYTIAAVAVTVMCICFVNHLLRVRGGQCADPNLASPVNLFAITNGMCFVLLYENNTGLAPLFRFLNQGYG